MTTTTTVISPPQVFISTRASTDSGNGLASSATFASTGQVNLILRVSNEHEFTASRTAVGGGGLEGDITFLPDTDDVVPWLRDVPWLWDILRPGSSPPTRPQRGAAAPAAQPGTGAAAGHTGVAAPAEDSEVMAIDSFFTDPETVAPRPPGMELLFDTTDSALSISRHGTPAGAWGFPLAAGAVALCTPRERPAARTRRYRPAIEARR
jgi:hypothetical protein